VLLINISISSSNEIVEENELEVSALDLSRRSAIATTTTTEEVETININSDEQQQQPRRKMQINPGAASCAAANVPPCAQRAARDLLFLVDSSNSMDPNRFYGEMLDYTQLLFCAFDSADANRVGMIIFAQQIKVQIPLGQYSKDQWFALVNKVRASRTTATPACCSCCTPHAEAFQLAKTEFDQHGIKTHQRIAFVITDGTPYQNVAGPYRWSRSLNEAQYALQTVPLQANILKASGVRLFLVGVPNAQGRPPEMNYFAGIPDPAKVPQGGSSTTQCYSRVPPRVVCGVMLSPPFPIFSRPIADNLFGTSSWNLQGLIDDTLGSLCKLPPSKSPTSGPTTAKPTSAQPTLRPTTKAPTFAPSKRPSYRPSKSPTRPVLNHIDLHFVLDHSLSMTWDHEDCRAAPGADASASDDEVCWFLFLGFAQKLVDEVLKFGPDGRSMGWSGLNADKSLGLRVNILGFACKNDQQDPLVYTLGHNLDTPTKFNEAITKAKNSIPHGGTCPSEAIDRTVAEIQFTLDRPFDVVVLTTDGVFYDMPGPARAARGLQYFGVPLYALGIAIPKNGANPGGLTREEMITQREQLSALAGDTGKLFDLGSSGYNLLSSITKDLAARLPLAYTNFLQNFVLKNPYWCGYTTGPRCESMDKEIPTGKICKWDWKSKTCYAKPRCARPQSMCGTTFLGITDTCCEWDSQGGKKGKGGCVSVDNPDPVLCDNKGNNVET